MNPTPDTLPALLDPFKTEAVARACGVHSDTVYAWKRLERVPRDADTIQRLAHLLKIDAGNLLQIIAADAERLRAA